MGDVEAEEASRDPTTLPSSSIWRMCLKGENPITMVHVYDWTRLETELLLQ